MHTSLSPQPMVRVAILAMLVFSLCAATLLIYLGASGPVTPTKDRYGDKAWKQTKLAHGMGWLHKTLEIGSTPESAPAPDCKGLKGQDQFDCRRAHLNQRLAQAQPPRHLAAKVPDEVALSGVLVASSWLMAYGGTADKLSALLVQGEEAARQSLANPFRLSGSIEPNPATLLPHATHMLNSIYSYTAPTQDHSPNVAMLRSAPGLETPIAQGRHVTLTLDVVQNFAQTTAACYTGDATACKRCTWCNSAGASVMYEQARARSVGILVLNAKTGAIEAAASSYTRCFAQQQRGEAASPGCPLLPSTLVPHLDRLGNQALERRAKPGSTTKIIIALALLKSGLNAAETTALADILTYSQTEKLIDIVMCEAQGFDTACAQKRLAAVAKMAQDLGWSGNTDVLGAGQLPGLEAQRFTARLLSHTDGTSMTAHPLKLTREGLQLCAKQGWRACPGSSDLHRVISEMFGTGDALATPLGVGNALLHIATAANHSVNNPENLRTQVPQAHLIHTAQDDTGKIQTVLPAEALVLSTQETNPVLAGMLRGATHGSALAACLAAAKVLPDSLLPCGSAATPQKLIRVAGKTGTPVMSADNGKDKSLTLSQWRTKCSQLRQAWAQTPESDPAWHTLKNEVGKCDAQPTKWYSFLLSAPGSKTWDRIVVIQVERNWNQKTTGLIDSPNDKGSNVAAEAGLALVNALYYPKALP